ncbi:MAG: tRNA (5-methylaminomethyl-2-thiouridine)(34)-methyltransferase MnmD [Hyphomonadaceae bacterium]
MPRLPPLPDLEFHALEEGGVAPFARGHGDVYFSGEGLSEKRLVFLTGCGLPEGWAGREQFTVGELGFGTGLNLLALWELWRRHRPSPAARLDVMSFEGLLMPRDAAERAHAAWPELAGLSFELREKWPARARGVQRIFLSDGVTLTLFVDEIASSLPQARAHCDAWFLDGFAPAKNPEMWSTDVLGHVARLSAAGALAATYTVAGDVRRALQAVGFEVAKVPGHGRKKERLEARLVEARPERTVAPKRVAIIGAGVAGACAARAFVRRECSVTVYDQAGAPGNGASGNPLALVMPRLDAADGPTSRALLEAWLMARPFYLALGEDAAQVLDAVHLPRGEREAQRLAQLLADPPLTDELLQAEGAGLRHVGAVAVWPQAALARLMEGAEMRFGVRVASVDEIDADLVVVCAGMGVADIGGLAAPAIEGRLGQVDWMASHGLPSAIADGGYAVEAFGQLVFGATFETSRGEPEVSAEATAHNLDVLARLRPDAAPGEMSSRAAIRATTQDRLPFAGRPLHMRSANEKAPDGTPAPSGRNRLIGGLGSRGFLWAPLLAELVASEALGDPLPVETSVADCLDPGRFVARAMRRGNSV